MRTCTHRLADGPLVCTLPADHTNGCVYEASDAPDRHDKPGRGDSE